MAADNAKLKVAVVGGGPSGAHLAARTAAAGLPTVLLEEKPAWEKPCGGGVTDKALRQFPFLADGTTPRNRVSGCDLESPAGRRVAFELDRPLSIFSRTELHAMMTARAQAAGAEVVRDRVVGIEGDDGGWCLRLRAGAPLRAAAVAIACGARSAFRAQFGPALKAGDWMATAGYHIPHGRLPWPTDRIQLRFLDGIEGYIWSFPRTDHASVGICGKMAQTPTAVLRARLEQWLAAAHIEIGGAPFYAHLLPAPGHRCLTGGGYCGGTRAHPWAVVGDAAGLVDPITGEGLYYALQSAELLAQAWIQGEPARYANAIGTEILPELAAAARIAERFFHGRFLGRPVLERMTQFTTRSRRFRQLMCDLFAGSQSYCGLRRRLYRNLAPALWEMALAQGREME